MDRSTQPEEVFLGWTSVAEGDCTETGGENLAPGQKENGLVLSDSQGLSR